MTKKHYEAIARLLSGQNADLDLCESLARYFKSENPNFDRQRFLKACGY